MGNNKVNPFYIFISALTILVTVYLFYVTIFEQIINNQVQGKFYAGIFVFILVLVFLLFNLFTKLIATSAPSEETLYWRIISIGVLVVLASLFLFFRLRINSTIEASETSIYKSAVAINDGVYSQSMDLVRNEMVNPAQYVYSIILALIFKLFGASTKVFTTVSAVLYVLCGFITYRITKRFTNNLCGLFAALLCFVMPGQFFAVYSYNASPILSLILLLTIDVIIELYLLEDNREADKSNVSKKIILIVFSCVLGGLLIFCEPVWIIPLAFVVLAAFLMHRDNALYILIVFAVSVVLFALLSFGKSMHNGEDFGMVLSGTIDNFNVSIDSRSGNKLEFKDVYSSFTRKIAVQEDSISDNYYYLKDSTGNNAYSDIKADLYRLSNQLLYMFLIEMAGYCVIISMKEKLKWSVPLFIAYIGNVVVILFEQGRETNNYSLISILIIICGCSIHCLYLNHHPEQKVAISALDALEKTGRQNKESVKKDVSVSSDMTDAEFVKRAKALIFIGNDENLYQQIKSEEHKIASLRKGTRVTISEDTFDDYDDDFFLDKEDDGDVVDKPADNLQSNTENSIADNLSVTVNETYTNNISEVSSSSVNNIPVWKQRPEKVGSDEMFFDEEDALELKMVPEFQGMTTMSPEPVVEVVSRNSTKNIVNADIVENTDNNDYEETSENLISVDSITENKDSKKLFKNNNSKKEKAAKKVTDKKSKNKETASSKSFDVTNNGRSIRRVKNVGGTSNDSEVEKYMEQRAQKMQNQSPKQVEEIPNPLPVPAKKEHKALEYSKKGSNSSGWDFEFDVDDDSDWDV